MAQYSVNNYTVENIIGFIKAGEIAIPEIQRPFVWDSSKVRDLLDSLYQGYPIGYIIVWQNPDVKLKDGTISSGKKVLIDGQQRVMSLTAAIVGQKVVGEDYREHRIVIAFNPLTEKFEVSNNALAKSPAWVTDIAEATGTAPELTKGGEAAADARKISEKSSGKESGQASEKSSGKESEGI